MEFSVFERPNYNRPWGALSLDIFASIVSDPAKGGPVFLKAAKLVEEIRQCTDKDMQKKLKQKCLAISPGTRFGINRQDIQYFTGLMQIDIDKGITDPESLRNNLGKLSWVTFSALSVRRRVWFLARIPEPEKQHLYWEKINAWLNDNYGLCADPARKNATDLRFYAPDENCIYNPGAVMLPFIQEPDKCAIDHTTRPIENKRTRSGYLSPITDFNQRADVVDMLLQAGWKISHEQGVKIRFTRPGKQSGISADWHKDKRRLYVFTDNGNLYQETTYHGLSAIDILMQLKQISSFTQARTIVKEMGYGIDPAPNKNYNVKTF
jgi:hypothetical protein